MAARLLSCPSAISSPTLGPGGPASRLPGSSKARSLPWSLPSSGLSLLPLVQLTSLLPSSGLTSPSCAASPTPLWEHRRASCTLPQNSLLRFTCAARSVSEVGEESGSSGSQLGSARNPDQFPALSHGQLCCTRCGPRRFHPDLWAKHHREKGREESQNTRPDAPSHPARGRGRCQRGNLEVGMWLCWMGPTFSPPSRQLTQATEPHQRQEMSLQTHPICRPTFFFLRTIVVKYT